MLSQGSASDLFGRLFHNQRAGIGLKPCHGALSPKLKTLKPKLESRWCLGFFNPKPGKLRTPKAPKL